MKKHFYISLVLGLLSMQVFAQRDLIISGGGNVSSLVCANNQVYAWGNNYGSTPVAVPIPGNVRQVNSGSGGHFVALGCEGRVWAWGGNDQGQLGNGSSGESWIGTPAQVKASAEIDPYYVEGGFLYHAEVVYAGNNNSYAILENGDLVAWGANSNRRAGNSTTQGDTDDTWNDNSGQLGNGNTTNQTSAVYVKINATTRLTNVVQIFAGDNIAMALTADGTVYSWGAGYKGTLGRNAAGTANPNSINYVQSSYAAPVWFHAGTAAAPTGAPVGRMTNIQSINCGDGAGYALDANGYVWSWGNGGWNNLTGTGAAGSVPYRVRKGETTGASNDGTYLLARAIGAGQGFAMAVTVDNKPVAWGGGGCDSGGVTGNNSLAGSGTGHGDMSATAIGNAVYVRYGTAATNVHDDVILINRGDTWGFYGRSNGDMYAWGCNADGQLGLGNTTDRAYAVQITPPGGCDFKDPLPTANITPKDTAVCESKLIADGVTLKSGYEWGPTLAPRYTITWYKDDVQVQTGLASVAANQTYKATAKGKYRVEISYTGSNNGCDPYPTAKDSMVLSVFPQQFEAPTDLEFCGDSAEVHVNPKAPATAADIAKKVYEWYPKQDSPKTDALGITTGTGTNKIKVSGGTLKGDSIIVYVEEIGGAAGMFMKRSNAACQTALKDNFLNPGAISNQSWTGFTVTEEVTITELKFLLAAWLYAPGSFTATIRFDIRRGSSTGTVAGSLTGAHTTTATSEATGLAVVTATGSVTLAPGDYYIGPANYANGGATNNNAKLWSTSCTLSAGGNDDVSGSIITHTGMLEGTNPSTTARTNAFDIKFRTAQQFCDRIPVIIGPCPCDRPKKEEMMVVPNPQTMCKDGAITLKSKGKDGTGNVVPKETSSQFVFSWYKGQDTLVANRILGPTPTPVGVGGKLDLPLEWVATDTTIYTLKVNNTTQESCYDTIQVTVISYPTPELTKLTIDPVCSEDSTVTYEAESKTVGTTFSWTRAAVVGISNPAGSGTNGTISEKLINTTDAPIIVTYVFTLKANGCENTQNVTVTINPKPTVTKPDDQALCAGKETTAITFTGAPTTDVTYNWTNDKSGTNGIGLADKGTGNIAAFTAKNTGTTQVIANLTVTPVSTEGCTGLAKTFTITVKPEPIIKLESAKADDEKCANVNIDKIEYSYSGGATGAKVTWSPSEPTGITATVAGGKITFEGKTATAGVYTYTIASDGQHTTCDTAKATGKITINAIPDKLSGSQLTIDLLKGSSPISESLDGRITPSPTTNTVLWYTTPKKPDGTGSATAPMQDKSTEKTDYYWVTQKSPEGCESDTAMVTVNVNDAPKPTVRDTAQCLNETPASVATLVKADDDHKLLWYANETDSKESGTATPPNAITTNNLGVQKFYVAQQNDETLAISEKSTIFVTVIGVDKPDVSANTLEYCTGDAAKELTVTTEDNNANYYYADPDGMVWYKGDPLAVQANKPSVETNVTATTTYDFGVQQTYKIPSTVGTVCKGDTAKFTVTVNVAPTPTVENVRFKRKDLLATASNILKTDDAGKTAAVTNCTGCTLEWSEQADKNDAAGVSTTWSTTPPSLTPGAAAQFDKKNETQYFWVRQKEGNCFSEPVRITVRINDSPSPLVDDVSYCEGGNGQVDAVTATANTESGTGPFDLQWYRDEAKTQPILPASATLPVSEINTTVPAGQSSNELKFYVTQKDQGTGVESEPTTLTITVYANPVLKIINPVTPCETSVEINDNNVWSQENTTKFNATPKFFANATDKVGDANTLMNTLVAQSGTYYIGLYFNNTSDPANEANKFCYSGTPVQTVQPIKVTIDSLTINEVIAPATTCPGTAVPVEAKVTANNGNTITYAWTGTKASGAFEGFNGASNLAIVNTNNLTTVEGTQYTFNVAVEAGACKGTFGKNETSGTLTIGSGPVIGTMEVTESGNTFNPESFDGDNGKNPWEFWACGGNIEIATNYVDTDPNSYKWYIEGSNTVVGTGKTLSVTNMITNSDRTYRLEYLNQCDAFVLITIKARPITAINNLQPIDMGLCEDDPFTAELTMTGDETGVTKIEWKKGSEVVGDSNPFTIANAKPADSGVYSYTVTSRGCIVTNTIAGGTPLNVSDKITYTSTPIAAVCEGGEVEVQLASVYPSVAEGTTLIWKDKDGNEVGQGLSINVTPPFTESNADANRRSTYEYTIDARYFYCPRTINVQVYVDEPLTGTIANDTVCEGTFPAATVANINANFGNTTNYVWSENEVPFGTNASQQTVYPTNLGDNTYKVDMTRGECTRTEMVNVFVNSNPVIIGMDSIGVRIREILYDPNFGGGGFMFAVDNGIFDNNPIKSDLTFGKHTFYMIDQYGCKAKARDYVLIAPPIVIPPILTPNGDNIGDTWEVTNLREVYPDAIVTIYDRFGKQLIQYKGEETGWDGTYLGKDMPSTDYWYQIDIKEIKKQYVGHFTLLRR